MTIKDWFKVRKYPHIGLPIIYKDRFWVADYIKQPQNISSHSFYPFIHSELSTRKFRKEYDENTDIKLNDGKRTSGYKNRRIYYACHLDSNIYSYYSKIISDKYEKALKHRNLENVAIAYRKIYSKKNKRGKNNVDFADEVFNFIRDSKEESLVAITFDIKSYFDNLDHKILKKSWCNLLKVRNLPNDHYNVFKSITKFSYVDFNDIYEEFKNELISSKKDRREKIQVKRPEYLKDNDIIAFCEKKDFKTRIRNKGYIKSNKLESGHNDKMCIRQKGIPQGSPISATLANIYLLDFDNLVNSVIKEINGIYRRYSDDMVVVCKLEYANFIKNYILELIQQYNLEIQDKKTNEYYFKKINNVYKCYKINKDRSFNCNRRFEFLGFEFDGEFTYLKSASLAKFYRKMKKSVKRGAFFAKYSKYKSGRGQIFKRRLYKRFSYLGARRKITYIQNQETLEWEKRKKHDWGNYLTYANMAQHNMRNNKIKSQIRRHWNILNNLIKDKSLDKSKNKSL